MIGTFVDKKGKNSFAGTWEWLKRNKKAYFIISSIRNMIGQEGTFMVEKATTLLFEMIEKEQKGLKFKVEGTLLSKIRTLMGEKGIKTLCQ